jgi:hypothetical protein
MGAPLPNSTSFWFSSVTQALPLLLLLLLSGAALF